MEAISKRARTWDNKQYTHFYYSFTTAVLIVVVYVHIYTECYNYLSRFGYRNHTPCEKHGQQHRPFSLFSKVYDCHDRSNPQYRCKYSSIAGSSACSIRHHPFSCLSVVFMYLYQDVELDCCSILRLPYNTITTTVQYILGSVYEINPPTNCVY